MNPVERAREARRRKGIQTELERILAIPRASVPPPLPSLGSGKLLPEQDLALRTLAATEAPYGLVGGLAVGAGKTLVAMLAPKVTGTEGKALLVLPASLRKQWDREVRHFSSIFPCVPPQVITYGKLSRPDSTRRLEDLAPKTLIFDEAHYLANLESARTRRVVRYMQRHPDTRVIVLSGSLTNASLNDYAHLCELALRERSPLPRDGTLELWASALDPDTEPSADDWLAVWPLLRAFLRDDPGPLRMDYARIPAGNRKVLARAALQKRLRTTEGVVLSREGSVGSSLYFHRQKVDCGTKQALTTLRDKWELPDGTELVDALEYARHAKTLALGYYQTVDVPPSPDWYSARREWLRSMRYALLNSPVEGRDSPALLTAACERGDAAKGLLRVYRRWKAHSDTPTPLGTPKWLPGAREALQLAVMQWYAEHGDGVVWYRSVAVQQALAEFMPVHGRGSKHPTARKVAASIPVHGKGWNGQQYHRCLILEVPGSASMVEQLLGRQHRYGQKSAVVEVWWNLTTWTHEQTLERLLQRAEYVQDSTGVRQKVLLGQWCSTH